MTTPEATETRPEGKAARAPERSVLEVREHRSAAESAPSGRAVVLPTRLRRETNPLRRQATPARISRWVGVRMYIAAAVVTLMFTVIGYKAWALQIKESDKYRKLAQRQQVHTIEVPAPRGPIVDVQGRELAVTADVGSVFANPREVTDVAGTAETLSAILEIDVRTLEAKLSGRRYFTWLARHVPGEQAEAVKRAGLGGIFLTAEPRRYYPGKELAGPILGFAGIDGNGLDGIELKVDELLRGEKARFAALRDASGRRMLADGMVKPQPGATVMLTLDRSIQYIAERALQDAVTEHKAKAGTIVVLDVKNGEVLAMASRPTYDPNAPGRAGHENARNRAVTDVFEIGSVMKVFTIAAALDAGAVKRTDVIDVEGGSYKVGRKIIRDTYHDAALSIGGIIKRSSNVGAVKVAQKLGKEGLHEALLRFGFGATTGIELPGERSGMIRDPKRWGDIGLASVSFGYGLMVTPLQVAAGLAAIGNRGVYQEPRIIRQVADARGNVAYLHEPAGRRVLAEGTATAMWPILASVFDKGRDGGTARALSSPNFPVGGKTGTARKVDPQTREYSQELYVASFAGLAPISEPRIAVVVVIDEPHGEHYYGGQVAGPAFVRVVDETLRYLGVPPNEPDAAPGARTEPDEPAEQESRLPAIADAPDAGHEPAVVTGMVAGEELAGDMVMIPDFTGMGVLRALDEARRAGISVEIEGTGRAIEQIPGPGPAPWPGECRIVFADQDDRPVVQP